MNSKIDFIFKRRSIRKYTNKPISKELINDLMEAAMAAPSAVNKKPYEFIIINGKNTLKKISEFLPHGKLLSDAPLGIIVCGDINSAHMEDISYMLQDCSAAIENLLLAVDALELGACWLGVHPNEDRVDGIKNIFKLPDNIIPVAAISIGYPADDKPRKRTQYNSGKIHINKW
jgi:nitroreductase